MHPLCSQYGSIDKIFKFKKLMSKRDNLIRSRKGFFSLRTRHREMKLNIWRCEISSWKKRSDPGSLCQMNQEGCDARIFITPTFSRVFFCNEFIRCKPDLKDLTSYNEACFSSISSWMINFLEVRKKSLEVLCVLILDRGVKTNRLRRCN